MIEEAFWLRFRFEPREEQEARRHVGKCCQQLLHGFKYYCRIQAILDHSRKVEEVQICDKIDGQRYLSNQEYMDQQPLWCATDAWTAMVNEWSDKEWIQKSITNRANCYSGSFKPHKGGSNSIAMICQKLSQKEGRQVSQIEAWVYTHCGINPQDLSSLNTEETTACLEMYKTKAIELNGPEFDWLHSPVDARALYQCSCGRPHGKWATFNGTVDDSEVLAEAKSDCVSSRASKRQRQEEAEREKRRLSEDARVAKEDARVAKEDAHLAKEYTQTILEWAAAQAQQPPQTDPVEGTLRARIHIQAIGSMKLDRVFGRSGGGERDPEQAEADEAGLDWSDSRSACVKASTSCFLAAGLTRSASHRIAAGDVVLQQCGPEWSGEWCSDPAV